MTPEKAPAARLAALAEIRTALESASRVVLTTHLNADGDGVGSEVALSWWLARRGVAVTIVNPTPPPETLAFLLEGCAAFSAAQPEGMGALDEADLIAVLDTAERHRLGRVGERLDATSGVLIDHHPPAGPPIVEPSLRDPTACATGELVFDLLGLDGDPLTGEEAVALYVAIVTDTGSFRFSNSTPRAHQIAGELIRRGADPEALYRRLFAQYTPGGLTLVRLALETLTVDPALPIAWIDVTYQALRESGARPEDTDGLVEYPRRLRGVEVALVFRELGSDRTKVSLRSNGMVDVAAVARRLGGGGHEKASGVVFPRGLAEAREDVLGAVREAVREAAAGARRREGP